MKSQRFGISKLPYKKTGKLVKPEQDVEEKQLRQEEEFNCILEEEKFDSDGEDCELHVYERRRDIRGEEVYLRAGTKLNYDPPKKRSHRACLVLNRNYNAEGVLLWTELEIQSRHIIQALRNVIRTYHGIDFTSKYVKIEEPPRCLFHYQDELRRYADLSVDQQLKSHMRLCLQYMEKVLHREIKISDSVTTTASRSLGVEHRHLWMLFKPGCLLYETTGDGMGKLSRLRTIYDETDDDDECLSWQLGSEFVRYDGDTVGFTHYFASIKRYEGCKPICELSVVPLEFHPEKSRIRDELLARGCKYLSMYGIRHCFYDGMAGLSAAAEPQCPHIFETNIRQRIVLDAQQYKRSVAASSPQFIYGTKSFESCNEAKSVMSEEEIMTCSDLLPGYGLESKRWGLFFVSKLIGVDYNHLAFNGLVLSDKKKQLISSLVEPQHEQLGNRFEDLIQGKGKGLIFLLHGPPGVGKTYTAESIAEHTRRPLLKITSDELYGPGHSVDKRLSEMFLYMTRWSGVLLLDEADVFMQERTLDNMIGNQLVSTLLRVLEYYDGILFLTTNRVKTIDHAFKSRIHVSIAYPPLSANARRELWNASIVRANGGQSPEWLDTEFMSQLVEKQVNGREIHNIVRTGHALASAAKRNLQTDDVLAGLDAFAQFDLDMNEGGEQSEAGETTA